MVHWIGSADNRYAPTRSAARVFAWLLRKHRAHVYASLAEFVHDEEAEDEKAAAAAAAGGGTAAGAAASSVTAAAEAAAEAGRARRVPPWGEHPHCEGHPTGCVSPREAWPQNFSLAERFPTALVPAWAQP